MSKKSIFVILWLTMIFSLPALALDEKKNSPCWEETRPADPVGCLAQLDKMILRTQAEKTSQNKKHVDLEVKLLKVDRKRIEKQTKEKALAHRRAVQRQEREMKAENNADIFCPDPKKKVEVKILNDNHFIFNRWQAFNRVTIHNPFGFTVRVFANDPSSTSSGGIVDLPGGCTITLSRSIRPLWETAGYGTLQYQYTAQALNPEDQRGIARSQPFSLYSGNSFQQMNAYSWTIGNFQTNY